jgi:hypothetical protein
MALAGATGFASACPSITTVAHFWSRLAEYQLAFRHIVAEFWNRRFGRKVVA